MQTSKDLSRIVYNLFFFYIGTLLSSLFIRNFVGELVSVVGLVMVMIATIRISRIPDSGLKGGSICFFLASVFSLFFVPEQLIIYGLFDPAFSGNNDYFQGLIGDLPKFQDVGRGIGILIGGLKFTGWLLWMRSEIFSGMRKMFYFLFANVFVNLILVFYLILGGSIKFGRASMTSFSFVSYVLCALGIVALGIIVYRLAKRLFLQEGDRKYVAFLLYFLTGACFLPFLFVGFVTFLPLALVGYILLLRGIYIRSSMINRFRVFYWWLLLGGLVLGVIIYKAYYYSAPFSPVLLCISIGTYLVVSAGYVLLGVNEAMGDRRMFYGLGILSVLLIPLTCLYYAGIFPVGIAICWAWIWLPLYLICLLRLCRNYFQSELRCDGTIPENGVEN